MEKIIVLKNGKKLGHGENPHQRGYYYNLGNAEDPLAICNFKQLQGKEISFNNILDIDGALYTIPQIGKKPACVIIKHTNPCGAAISSDIQEAYFKAWASDPLAAFGSILL
jgi:phosphoribosylaminoimidazolecarboxamide formyltransferase/IMP cyclohydrolase